jgi:protein involved in polysaccharide export with SLBB domain
MQNFCLIKFKNFKLTFARVSLGCFLLAIGMHATGQISTPNLSGISSALNQANGNSTNNSSVESPLMSGNLGKGIDANIMNGSGKEGINSSSTIENQINGQRQGQLRNMGNQLGSGDPKPEVNNLQLPPLVPTQFQEFVKEATGKSLSLYGYNLFEGHKFSSLADVPVPTNYVVGPGDEIDLKVWGMTDNMSRIPVDRNGQISIPKVGTITIAGTRADQLELVLRSHFAKVFKNFEISANVGRLRSMQIFVVGQARKPGAYMVSSLSTLMGALFESGGPASTGTLRNIQLVRAGQLVSTLDLYSFIHTGDTSKDSRLLPGDVIVIPPAGARVAIHGATDKPAIYEFLLPEETLDQLLKYGGGQTTLSTPHKVQLERVDAQQIKGQRIVQSIAMDSAGLATKLKNNDIVTLFKISPEFANAVTLRGNVASPLRYPFKPGMRVSDLIPEMEALIQADYYVRKNKFVQFETGLNVSAERINGELRSLLEEINWDYATIERTDSKQVKTVLIPFNLQKAVHQRDETQNLQLEPGDVITIFGVKDLPVPVEKRTNFVRVMGEVKVPGIYQISGQESLESLIKKAGGLTHNAYLFGTVFTRESAKQQQQENFNKAFRLMQSSITSQTANLQQNSTDADKLQLFQMQSMQKTMLEKLQTLKVSGRVSLDIDAEHPTLPIMWVEDGDIINVPIKPSFVGVYGAVLTESSLLHRPSYSVGDYLDKAGLTREADLDEVMIIRADGSVEAPTKGFRKSLFASSITSKKLQAGDTIFVPEVVDKRGNYFQIMQGVKDWTQILFQMGMGAVAVKTLRQ